MVIKDFFPTPFLFHQVDPNTANQVEDLVVSRLQNLSLFDNLKTDFHHKDRIISIKEISNLYKEILKCKSYFEAKTGFSSSSLGGYWVQDYSENHFHETHNHGRNQLSVVYWVRANQDAGKFTFYSPAPQQSLVHGNIPQNNLTKYNTFFSKISPIKGGLLIFPSYIDHKVEEGNSNCIRTTISFNFYPNQL